MSNNDVEKGDSHELEGFQKPSKLLDIMESSALLTFWSILVINEGAIRLMATDPHGGLKSPVPPAPILLFLGGLFEVFFGLLGLALGVAACVRRAYSPLLTKLSMVVQTLLGYYVFVIYVFVAPAYGASQLETPSLAGITIGTSKVLITLGILTSFHFCLSLQGGQFVFMARMVCAMTGEDFLKQKSGNRMRGVFWNANMALSGLWTLITGAIIQSKVDSSTLPPPYAFPPNVGTLPGLTIFTGLIVLIWGTLGMIMAFTNAAPSFYFIGTFPVFLIAFLNYGIAQFSTFSPTNPAAVAMHNALVLMVHFLGPYFVSKAQEETAQID